MKRQNEIFTKSVESCFSKCENSPLPSSAVEKQLVNDEVFEKEKNWLNNKNKKKWKKEKKRKRKRRQETAAKYKELKQIKKVEKEKEDEKRIAVKAQRIKS